MGYSDGREQTRKRGGAHFQIRRRYLHSGLSLEEWGKRFSKPLHASRSFGLNESRGEPGAGAGEETSSRAKELTRVLNKLLAQ